MNKQWLTTKEVQREYNISRTTIWKLIKAKIILANKTSPNGGGKLNISRQSLENYFRRSS